MLRAACATLLLALATGSCRGADVAIVDATLVDVERGVAVPDTTVVVRDGTIVAIGSSGGVDVPAGAERIDGRGRWLVPGLWDLHVHTLWPGMEATGFPLFIANGVLGVRDMHAARPLLELARLRARVAEGRLLGPRLLLAGSLVDGEHPFWTASFTVGSAAEARDTVAKLAAGGMDFVKPYDSLDPVAFRALAAAARERGLGFAGHVPVALRALDAARDLQTIEHVGALALEASRDSAALRAQSLRLVGGDGVDAKALERWLVRVSESHDPEHMRALARGLAELGTCVTPTLVVGNADGRDRGWVRALQGLEYVPRAHRERWLDDWPRWRTAATARKFDGVRRTDRAVVRALYEAGVPLLAGTDVGNPFLVPGFSLHLELQALVDAGLTPLDALRAATVNARRCLGEEAGSRIAVGARAEIVLLDADPLADIRNTQRIRAVVLGARRFDRTRLDELLATAARRANAQR